MSSSETLDFVASVTVGRISRAVLSRVQTRSFNTIKLNNHPESLRQFDDVFSDETIRDLVKTVRYDVVLPVVSDKRLRNKFQSRKEAAENSRVFTEALVALFTRLSCWEGKRGIKLILTATSPSDDVILRTGNVRVKGQRNSFKYVSIETSVLPPDGLSPAPCISFLDIQSFDFSTGDISGRRLHPEVICIMATALPRLEHTIWDLYMPPRRMPTQRKQFKAGLSNALLQPLYNCLATMTIHLWDPDPRNEEAILVPDDEEDRLSLGIQRICELPTLVSLFLWGKWCISHHAFRRFGPSVRAVFVDMSMTTPDGGWLLDIYPGSTEEEYDVESDFDWDPDDQGDTLPDIDSENSDVEDRLPRRAEAMANQDLPDRQIREVPNPETFTPLVTSFVQAVANSTSSACLEFFEMRLTTELASMRLCYSGDTGGEDPRLGALPDFAQRIIKVEKGDTRRWRFDAYGGITASGWKIPVAMWDAMEKAVGEANIETSVDRMEGD
ncbi:hypothetical protein CEP54_002679 [Fusarium duplospermum]|uniref:Uncharacterized protein n=1 Tax=Fusarium duplospermum TaxID=1325734 RepID=A0A428QTS5_9HYPO|nr:hypothetical protein CEP54_002679 [Fusarium duplospermum]